MTATRAGTAAFREAYLSSDSLTTADFASHDARLARYAIYWSFYEASAYRDIHAWAPKLRADLGLYAFIRNIHSPAYRLGEFWAAHLQGGALDPEAGDGTIRPSALPIITTSSGLRRSISQLWQNSNLAVQKDVYCRWGAVLGDVALEVIDDSERGKVYLDVVHPGVLRSVDLDRFGNVKGYVRQETRLDPRMEKNPRDVTYTEEVTRDGNNVVYATYLDGDLYAWNGRRSRWEEPYGFVPLVVVQHNNVGLGWGWSEFHPVLGKIREADDLASALDDQIRIMVNAPFLLSGVKAPNATPTVTNTSSTTDPETARQEGRFLYGPPGADAKPLVLPVDIAATSKRITDVIEEIERDYPELRFDRLRASGEVSGVALRVARQPTETKVNQRRTGYDDALVRAQQMAIAIGGYRGYDGFEGFGLESYAAGALDHRIGERPVFSIDPLDQLEEDEKFWTVAESATRSGVPLSIYLRRAGWNDKDITDLEAAREKQVADAAERFDRAFNSGTEV